jgi:hypothetical protein
MRSVTAACPGAQPMLRVLQRHYRTQTSPSVTDALMEFDLRTTLPKSERKSDRSGVKYQPEWLEAAWRAFLRKRSNMQLEFGVRYAYSRCPEIRSRKALDLIAASWLASRPLMKVLGTC